MQFRQFALDSPIRKEVPSMQNGLLVHGVIAKFHYTNFVGDPGLVGSGSVGSCRARLVEFRYNGSIYNYSL